MDRKSNLLAQALAKKDTSCLFSVCAVDKRSSLHLQHLFMDGLCLIADNVHRVGKELFLGAL